MNRTIKPFAKYAWSVLGFNILVILWGAFVRATGSGAGCGSHWPLCNGVVIPREPQMETLIEFAHRITSGLALILVIGMLVWSWRAYPKGSPVRLGAWLSFFLIITEALVGAGLVLFEWVAHDVSSGRVISMAVHLINTFLLLGALTLTAWWASGGAPLRLRGQGGALWVILIGLLAIILVGVSGAVTALGDTLFPVQSVGEGLQQDFNPAAHFLVRIRIWHPVFAVISGFYLIFVGIVLSLSRTDTNIKRSAGFLGGLVGIQLIAGLVNVVLLAPVWMQILHLLLADSLWIALILLSANVLSDPSGQHLGVAQDIRNEQRLLNLPDESPVH